MNFRKGMGTLDVILSIVLGSIGFFAVVFMFSHSKGSVKAEAEAQKFSTVILAAERAKQDHSDNFPAMAASPLNAAGLVTTHLGGATAAANYSNWTYACVGTQVSIVAPAYTDSTMASLVAAKVSNSNPDWSASAAASGVITVTQSNTTCN